MAYLVFRQQASVEVVLGVLSVHSSEHGHKAQVRELIHVNREGDEVDPSEYVSGVGAGEKR